MSINWTHRTLVVPITIVEACRTLCAAATTAGENMFTTGLSADGTAPATHYVSSGLLDVTFASLLDSPEYMALGLEALGIDVSLEQCEVILSMSDVSDESAFNVLERLELKLIQE